MPTKGKRKGLAKATAKFKPQYKESTPAGLLIEKVDPAPKNAVNSPLSIASGENGKLKRVLGLYDATAIDMGAIIGAGIFVVIGVAASVAGSGLIYSLLLAGAISYITALGYAELSKQIPKEGGEYEFAYKVISHQAGFIDGILWSLSTTVSGAVVSLGFASYFVVLYPGLDVKMIALGIIAIMALLNIVGLKRSSYVNDALVVMKIAILLFFILFGIGRISYDNFEEPLGKGLGGIISGAAIIFFAFAGFGRSATIAEEVINPKTTIPRAILLALTVCTAIYLLTGFVSIGMLGADKLSLSKAPIAEAISLAGSRYAVILVAIGALAATASVLLTEILGISRIAYSMARNSQLPAFLSKIHSKYGTPYVAILSSAILMALLALFVDFRQIIEMSSLGLLGYYAVTNLSAFMMKRKNGLMEHLSRFRALIGLLSCVALMLYLAKNLLFGA
ncbi:MAG: amino acid permease [Candidatus Micrarchaeota archaeon]